MNVHWKRSTLRILVDASESRPKIVLHHQSPFPQCHTPLLAGGLFLHVKGSGDGLIKTGETGVLL